MGNLQGMNHFVMMMKVMDAPAGAGVLAGDGIPLESLEAWAGRSGFVILETAVDGNCGIHCMSSMVGMPHTAVA